MDTLAELLCDMLGTVSVVKNVNPAFVVVVLLSAPSVTLVMLSTAPPIECTGTQ